MSTTDFNAANTVRDTLARVPQRSVLADEVYEILRESLVSHRIEPGARLNLDQLARELHVSNTPVRQALGRLEADGLVTKEPFRGFTASPLLDKRGIAEIYEMRLLLEPVGAAKAAQHASSGERGSLRSLCDPEEIETLLAADGTGELGRRDVELHSRIASLSGNSIMAAVVHDLVDRTGRYTMYHQPGAARAAWHEHQTIVDALCAQDAKAAREAMRAHLAQGMERARGAVQ